ncbi:hypothetical protein [Maribellus sediminis]|uniref:hypothetical protein n=1 Tax=Maribellus sediminis TaxID=2696285 RepID=UPI001430EABE|nr:hypothetical protein [Maribellus sediminis]
MKKEFYRHNLPHFQQPGQAYFVTWILKDAVPKRALLNNSKQLAQPKLKIGSGVADSDPQQSQTNKQDSNVSADWNPPHPDEMTKRAKPYPYNIVQLKREYREIRKKYIQAYNQLLDNTKPVTVDLSQRSLTDILRETLLFWEDVKLKNFAFCIMPTHVHWVFVVFEKDNNGEPVYLQDILYSVKRFSAGKINKLTRRTGALWQKESFDTTIRDEKHLYNAVEYTLNNPVNAGLINNRNDWPGNFICNDFY